jgi:hypothetical protein
VAEPSKGEYWNLGAGAEIGIYYTDDQASADNGYYEINTDLRVHVSMKITYRAFNATTFTSVLDDFHQTNWWVTSFSPFYQHPAADQIGVELKVRFTGYVSSVAGATATVATGGNLDHLKLMKSFYEEWYTHRTERNWPKVSMLPYANKPKPTGHTSHPKCGARPENCNHVCPSGSILCGGPCTQYTTKCVSGDPDCQHFNEIGNGFQFGISY